MTKDELEAAVAANIGETHDALAEVWGALNHGQRQKLLKNAQVAALLRRYGVIESEGAK